MKVWRGDYLAHSGCQTVFPRLALGGGWSRLGWVTMGLLVIQSLSHCNLVPCHYPPGQGYQGWGWGEEATPHDSSRVGVRQEMREALEPSYHSPALTSSGQGT